MKNTFFNSKSFTNVKLQAARLRLAAIIAVIAVIGFSMAGCDNGTTPTPTGFTVTFNSAGGTAVASQTGIASGGFATAPANPTRAFPGAGLWAHPMPTATTYTFNHWSAPGQTTPFVFTTPITGNITLTAQWSPPATPVALDLEDTNLVAAAVTYVNENPGTFTLLVGDDVTVASVATLAENVHLTIAGIGGRQTISRTGNGNLFNVNGANRSLTLGDNITLTGHAGNTLAVVNVDAGGRLTMNAGAQITGNTASAANHGGGVDVTGAGSTFTMNGGEIFGNATTGNNSGGGVRIALQATFVMHEGAVIRDNTAEEGNIVAGGVHLFNPGSTFRMLGGEIRGNTAMTDGVSAGGGVRISAGTFQVVTGVIYGGDEGANSNTGSTNNALVIVTNGTVTLGTMADGVFTPSMYEGNPVTLDNDDDTIEVINGVRQ